MLNMDIKYILVLLCVGGTVQATVDTTWMRSNLEQHFSKPRHHVTNPEYKQQAKEFIKKELKSYGLETEVQVFDTSLSSVKGANVIGVLKGKYFGSSQDRVVGLMAHYDTVRDTPGVDDNGAAVVAMLQAAKYIAKYSRNFTVIVAAVDFEEWEEGVQEIACTSISCGSESLVKDWVPSFWKSTPIVTGVIVMDTIMNIQEKAKTQDVPEPFKQLFPNVVKSIESDDSQGDFLAAIGRPYDSHLLSAFTSAYRKLAQPEFQLEKFNISVLTGPIVTTQEYNQFQDLMRSDHYTFWKNQIPAIFLTDTANFRGYMKTCYHHICDDMTKVTDKMIQFAGKTAQALIDTVEQLAPSTGRVISGAGSLQTSCGLMFCLLVYTVYSMHM